MLVCCLTDINECEDDGVCEHRCINRIGDYRCKCRKGYRLMDDEKSCKGKNIT